MRKVMGIILMGVVVFLFIVSSRDKTYTKPSYTYNESQYPSTPTKVIEAYNEMIKIPYHSMTSEDVATYVEHIRHFYADEFLKLNPKDEQILHIKQEIEEGNKTKLKLIQSKIEACYIEKDAKGEDYKAEVSVEHVTTLGTLKRTYELTKENGEWKIYRWKDTMSDEKLQTEE